VSPAITAKTGTRGSTSAAIERSCSMRDGVRTARDRVAQSDRDRLGAQSAWTVGWTSNPL
jgi:hypothetical protein